MSLIKDSLYKISDDFKEVRNLIESGELTEDQVRDQLEAIDMSFDKKIEQVALTRKAFQQKQKDLDEEIKRLTDWKKSCVNTEKNLASYMVDSMGKLSKTKVKGDLVNITSRIGKEALYIDDQDLIDDDFIEVSIVSKVDKVAITKVVKTANEFIASGHHGPVRLVKGVRLERGKNTILVR